MCVCTYSKAEVDSKRDEEFSSNYQQCCCKFAWATDEMAESTEMTSIAAVHTHKHTNTRERERKSHQ